MTTEEQLILRLTGHLAVANPTRASTNGDVVDAILYLKAKLGFPTLMEECARFDHERKAK